MKIHYNYFSLNTNNDGSMIFGCNIGTSNMFKYLNSMDIGFFFLILDLFIII